MPAPILATKLYVPSVPPRVVPRHRLFEQLDEGLHRKLTLISAPAGFGKTTLLSAWVAGCDRQVAWLSLDDADNDPTRFLNCASQTCALARPKPPSSSTRRWVSTSRRKGSRSWKPAPKDGSLASN